MASFMVSKAVSRRSPRTPTLAAISLFFYAKPLAMEYLARE